MNYLSSRHSTMSFTLPRRVQKKTTNYGSVAQWLGRWTCATGGRGFNPSRCTVECDLGQVVHTHCPAPGVTNLYGAI